MVVKTGLTRKTWLLLAIVVLAGAAAVGGYFALQAGDGRSAPEQVEQPPTPVEPGPEQDQLVVVPATSSPVSEPALEPSVAPLGPSPASPVSPTLSPHATSASGVTPSDATSESTSASAPTVGLSPSAVPSVAQPTSTTSPPIATPSPRVGPIEGAEPYELRVDEAGRYFIPDRGDGCLWTEHPRLTPLQGGDSPIIVLYSDCEAKFYLAYHVAEQYIGNVTKAPVYQPLPLTPADIGLGADGKYYVPDRGDGCAYWEIARPTIGDQQWVMLRSELCHHFLWRFSLTTGDLFPMDPLWWPDRSAPSPSDIQVGPDGRYFIVRSDGCTWVESSRKDTWVYFTTECSLTVTFAFAYDSASGEFHDVGLPP